MDWAIITQTIERLDTLDPEELAGALHTLEQNDPDLLAQISSLRAVRANAVSFMQTRMPEAACSVSRSLEPGTVVGIWRIGKLLGAGGMGEVYQATRADGLFEQQVALKLAKAKSVGFHERFEAERQRLAQLEHPNIARIVDGGATDDGAPYMTMEFVDGQPTDIFAHENRLDRGQRIALIEQLCAAVTHAHGRLILHRDIKHDNVLINQDGELRLIDFGVASLMDDAGEDEARTPLTIAYAAPEQLRGEPVSAATDIFAIGMLAHLLEAGALPRRQPDGGVTIDRGKIADRDLCAILAKATAEAPADRYASADALRDDLQKLAGGFPVAARPVSSVTRFRKLVARNKLASAMSGAAAAAVIAGVIGVSVFAVRANEEAEASRIAQQQGASTIELYETFNSGFNRFVASIDPESERGDAIFGALEELEADAKDLETNDPQKSLETYVFLAEIYADIGRDQDASRIAQKLAASTSEFGYASAFTLAGLVHLSEGYVETDELTDTLDRLHGFFSRDPAIHSFDIAFNRCVRARLTKGDRDAQTCVDLATSHLAGIDMNNYAQASGNLPLVAYAVDSAVELEDYEKAKRTINQALAFYEGESRPGSMPQALFLLRLSDIAQIESEWSTSKNQVLAARASLDDASQFPWLEVAIGLELAKAQIGLEEFDDAEKAARDAHQQAIQVYGPDHFQVRETEAQLAMALAGQGREEVATEMMREIIAAEQSNDNDPTALGKYRGMLAKLSKERP